VQSYRRASFTLNATITVEPDRKIALVLAAVEQALRSHFSFEAREFGQLVTLSEVLAVMQAVDGVRAVDVDTLRRTDGTEVNGLERPLTAVLPHVGDEDTLVAAELLTLDPRPVALVGALP
jgi:hypothetical protein